MWDLECGSQRIGLSRLFELARMLDVAAFYFCDEILRIAWASGRCRAAASHAKVLGRKKRQVRRVFR
jgi:hypothetical protein